MVVGSPAPQGSVQQAKKIRAITDSDVRAWFAKESVLEIKDIPQLLRGSGLESRENKTLITEIIKAITKKVGKGKLRLK